MRRSAILVLGALLGAFLLAYRTTPPGAEPPAPVEGRVESGRPDRVAGNQGLDPGASEPVEGPAPEEAILVRVSGPDGRPVELAQGRIWRSRGGSLVRDGIDIRDGLARYPLGPEVDSPLWIEIYGATGCGAVLLEPVDPRPQVVPARLPPPLAISGTARDEEGAPVAGVRLRAWAVHPELPTPLTGLGRPHSETASGRDGAFRLDGLGAGGYLIRAEAPPGLEMASPDPASPVLAGTEGVELRCRRCRTMVFTVLGPGGRPIPDAEVFLAGDLRRAGRTDDEGRAVFEDVDPSELGDVVITPPDERVDLLPKTVRDGLPADRTVQLELALDLAGDVRDEGGRSVPDALVEWRPAGSPAPWTEDRTDENGRFRILRVPPGPVEVRAAPPGYFGRTEPGTVRAVEAGAQDVVLVVGSTPMLSLRFEDWGEGETGVASLHFAGEGPFLKLELEVGESGIVRFAGLRANDVVEVFVRTSRGRVWVGRDLRPRDGVRPVRGLARSLVSGRILGLPRDREVSVHVTVLWAIELAGTVEPDGRFEIPGVPAGRWPLEARTTGGGELLQALTEVAAGTDVRIELSPR